MSEIELRTSDGQLPLGLIEGTEEPPGLDISKLLAKTGSLTDVKSLAGYWPVDSGGTIQFALIENATAIEQGGYLTVWNDLVNDLATYPSAATEADLAPR